MYIRLNIQLYIYIHTYIYNVHTHKYVCMYIYILYVYIYFYISIYIYMYYTYIYVSHYIPIKLNPTKSHEIQFKSHQFLNPSRPPWPPASKHSDQRRGASPVLNCHKGFFLRQQPWNHHCFFNFLSNSCWEKSSIKNEDMTNNDVDLDGMYV